LKKPTIRTKIRQKLDKSGGFSKKQGETGSNRNNRPESGRQNTDHTIGRSVCFAKKTMRHVNTGNCSIGKTTVPIGL
jgi:hypothetical protein